MRVFSCSCSRIFTPAGKREKITITNDKGRLSEDEINRMVSEAEEFAEADKKVKGRIDARNKLETYAYNMRSTIGDKLGDKLSDSDKATVGPLLGMMHRVSSVLTGQHRVSVLDLCDA